MQLYKDFPPKASSWIMDYIAFVWLDVAHLRHLLIHHITCHKLEWIHKFKYGDQRMQILFNFAIINASCSEFEGKFFFK